MLKWFRNKVVYIKAFNDTETRKFAEQWKKYGAMNKQLSKWVTVTALERYCESERDKKLIKKVAKMQNEMLHSFYKKYDK